jgi:RNA polymerase sigma factor for flagellar operon FliA
MQKMMITMRYDTAAGAAPVTTIGPASSAPLKLVRRTVVENRVPVKPESADATVDSSRPRPIGAAAAKLALRDQAVLEHLPLVKAIATRVHRSLPVHVDLDDLVHAGILGLLDAANKYDPKKRVVFPAYAKHRIKGAILDSLRQLDWASRDMRRRHKQIEAAIRDLASILQRAPTEAEIAEKLATNVDRLRTMMLDMCNVGLISASTRSNEDNDPPARDFPSDRKTHPDSICAHQQLRSVLSVARKTLPERYEKVILLYYTNEMTMKEIGGVLGINESRVSQIHKSALEMMQTALQATGVTSSQAF